MSLARHPLAQGAAAVAGLHALPALTSIWPPLRRPLGVRERLASDDGVALTFDDGPHPRGTPATLEMLAAAGVRATFFLVGEQVRARPALVGEIVAAGHEVGVHCDRHRNLLRVGPRGTFDDLARAVDAIGSACGTAPLLHRPPYGVLTLSTLAASAAHGWQTWLWTRWGRDWKPRARPAEIVALATNGLRGGDVVLLHDADFYCAPESWRRMLGALPGVLEHAADAGFEWKGLK